jgi:hypothetical protein
VAWSEVRRARAFDGHAAVGDVHAVTASRIVFEWMVTMALTSGA